MHGYQAYKQAQDPPERRIDIILGLYSTALENLERARQIFAAQGLEGARPFLLKSQLAVMGLASALPGYQGKVAADFLRLYEFVSFQIAQSTRSGVDEAVKILRQLFESFQKMRDDALLLEDSNQIPQLRNDHLISVNV